MTSYAFGDSDLASRGLAVLAETFAGSSSEFMRRSINTRPRLAVDLGCGLGYSTQLLASILNPEHTTGLDNSEKFLAHAKTRASTSVSFHLHDITKTPFPTGRCDVMFSRFELTHLSNPEGVVRLWVDRLQPRGRLLIEEVDYIDTTNPILIRYLDVLQTMLRQQDGELYIGSRLDSVLDPNRVRRVSNRVHALKVPMRRAALMFLMNIRAWSGQEFVRREFGSATLGELEEQLGVIVEGDAGAATVGDTVRRESTRLVNRRSSDCRIMPECCAGPRGRPLRTLLGHGSDHLVGNLTHIPDPRDTWIGS